MNKDWTGNGHSIYTGIGASNHTDKEREVNDYYATSPIAIDKLEAAYDIPNNVWECACGEGHLAKRLAELGHSVFATDLVERGCGTTGIDFLATGVPPFDCECILTNPPYKYATEFVEHALEILPKGAPCIMLLKTTALESKSRYERLYSKGWLKAIYQFSERLLCAKNGDFEAMQQGGGSAVAYAWFVFADDGNNEPPQIYWI